MILWDNTESVEMSATVGIKAEETEDGVTINTFWPKLITVNDAIHAPKASRKRLAKEEIGQIASYLESLSDSLLYHRDRLMEECDD